MTRQPVTTLLVRGVVVARAIVIAKSFFQRFFGLLGRRSLSLDDGMVFCPGGGVHTIGMRCMIDVIFLNKENRVLKVCKTIKPFRFCMAPAGTYKTLELASGASAAAGIEIGEYLVFAGEEP